MNEILNTRERNNNQVREDLLVKSVDSRHIVMLPSGVLVNKQWLAAMVVLGHSQDTEF